MDAEKLVSAVERFFLDLIGTVAPGAVLIVTVMSLRTIQIGSLTLAIPTTTGGWALFILGSYVIGHAIASLGANVVAPVAARIAAGFRKVPGLKKLVPRIIVSEQETLDRISKRSSFAALVRRVAQSQGQPVPSITGDDVRPYRNVAMTIAADEKPTVLRLMFLSLLNLGIASVLWLIGFGWMALAILDGMNATSIPAAAPVIARGAGAFLVFVIVSVPFLERRFQFYSSSMHLPFDAAVAKATDKPVADSPEVAGGAKPIVYLAGGLRTDWQSRVVQAQPRLDFLNPRLHGLTDPAAYMDWDLSAIRKCDIVFAYMESTNPGGYALAAELGYAKALGKMTIVVDERSGADSTFRHYWSLPRAAADVVFDTFDEGLSYLRAKTALM